MEPEGKELEPRFAEYTEVKHALAYSSDIDTLILPLMTKNLSNTDAVFTSRFTFFASAEPISFSGTAQVFIDIAPDTYNLDPNDLEKKIHTVLNQAILNPKIAMPVDPFDLAADFNSTNKIAKKFNLWVIEDSAQSFGDDRGNRKTSEPTDVGATSFYPASIHLSTADQHLNYKKGDFRVAENRMSLPMPRYSIALSI